MWPKKRLKFVASLSRQKVDERSNDLPYIGLENVESWTGRLNLHNENGADTDSNENGAASNIFNVGDVLFGKLRPYLAKAFRSELKGFCSTEFLVMQPTAELDGNFLLYWLLRPDFIDQVNSSTFGARMPRADWEFVGNSVISLPPISEQQRIVAYLNGEIASLDELRQEKERLLSLLDLKRIALITHAITRGLDKNILLRPSGITWLGEVPHHWKVARLKNYVTRSTNGIWGNEPNLTGNENDLICLRVADFDREHYLIDTNNLTVRNIDIKEQENRVLESGDVLLEKSGGGEKQPVGFAVLFDHDFKAVCSNFVARLQISKECDPRFFTYVCAALYGMRINVASIKQTTGIQNLDEAAYFNEKVTFPPFEEQRAIAAHLNRVLKDIDDLKIALIESLDLLTQRRAALITEVVTGRLQRTIENYDY